MLYKTFKFLKVARKDFENSFPRVFPVQAPRNLIIHIRSALNEL